MDARDLILSLRQSGRLDEARNAAREAAAIAPQRFDIAILQGDLEAHAEQWPEAAAAYSRAAMARPDLAEVRANLSLYCWRAGQLAEAEIAARKAIQLKPGLAAAHNNLGNALAAQGNLQSAAHAYRQAAALESSNPEPLSNLGRVLGEAGQSDAAVAALHSALAIQPAYETALLNLTEAMRRADRPHDAIPQLEYALRIAPDNAQVWWALGSMHWQSGEIERAVDAFAASLERKPDSPAVLSNLLFGLLYDSRRSPAEVLARHREYSQRFELPGLGNCPQVRPSDVASRRIRVGYVSADLNDHPVAKFMEPLLKHHDRLSFEVYAYYSNTRKDVVSERLAQIVEHWVPCPSLDDEALAKRIRADGIDVLVDLAGHSGGNRMLTFARRPAPVQMTYLGYPGTTGLASMHYRITDGVADPPSHDSHYSEKLIRLPACLGCYEPMATAPEVAELPALKLGHVTFGSFNHVNKLKPPVLRLWAKLLHLVPKSRLMLYTIPPGLSRDRLLTVFGQEGVDVSRISMEGKLPLSEFLAAMSAVDVALDPFPMTGGTTTIECLWMGTPVVTLAGDRYATRVSASYLTSAGLGRYIADSPECYLDIAKELAEDLPTLSRLRQGMRAQLRASPILDAAGFARQMESVYRHSLLSV